MCDHTDDPGGREAAMVVIDPGTPERHGRDGIWCDPCIEPLIRALNSAGLRTVASYCGHGVSHGWVGLRDGRDIVISPNHETTIRTLHPDSDMTDIKVGDNED